MTRSDPRLLVAVALLTMLVGCTRQPSTAEAPAQAASSMDGMMATRAEAAAGAPAPALAEKMQDDAVQRPGVDAAQVASSAVTATDPRRRFVRTAQATFQVKDVYAATLAIEDAVAAEGGFVVRNAVTASEQGRIERPVGDGKLLQLTQVAIAGELVVRVPSERTQGFLRTIARQMQFLDARAFEANDVQFDLLRRELAYRRAQELQRDIRDAGERPGRSGEKIDAVQAREAMLAARDEAMVAQRELEDRIAFGTLTLQLRQPLQVREQFVPDTEAIVRERGPGFFARVAEALASGWRGLQQVAIVAVSLWPLWLAVVVALALVRGAMRWRRARPA